MSLTRMEISARPIAGAVPAWRKTVDAELWRTLAEQLASAGSRLGALWASDERDRGGGYALHAVYVILEGLLVAELPVDAGHATYPDISGLFACAGRMQRAAFDVWGVRAMTSTGEIPDPRP